jgi:D-xylose transport system ATP-binding protein
VYAGTAHDVQTDTAVAVRFTLARPGRLTGFRGPPADTSQPTFPIRASFYYAWYPEAWSRYGLFPYSKFRPTLSFYTADDGTMVFDGRAVRVGSPAEAQQLGIATVFQDLALCDNLDVVANLYLGREERGVAGLIDETTMERDATVLLRRLAVAIPSVRTPVASLSGGQRQSVAVARATMGAPKMVILDEPTAALGVPQTRQVLALIDRLRVEGLAVVVISHNLVDVFQIADRIIVLRLGSVVFDGPATDVTQSDFIHLLAGFPIGAARTASPARTAT